MPIKRTHPLSEAEFLKTLDDTIAQHNLLEHPFYQLWNEGKLTKKMLGEYSKQYYAHVRSFPVYLSAVHSRCENPQVRQLLLENLIEEEQGEENHPELWLRFAEGLGVQRSDVQTADYIAETQESVETFKSLTTSDHFIDGVAALYAFESQVPEIARTKREGLAKFYGLSAPETVSYFSVHEQADIGHREAQLKILGQHCTTVESQERTLNAADRSAKAMWHFLDGVQRAFVEPSLN
ncbi:CADD family putative folate metabolism protein [candidate division KSB1 bacterium]|nr:CADD family putative folate metabolism protein [candidate division KSB1 bacterium]NIR71091.1 CADD family putative folate metabolism protein [candidate division KSB1 bacterium]NIS27901.1 CADD family putative folate metabolism protein [candidate division KSB1 bacterium]NIT74784.1 CADD family putative folate metabolism protein [candidate division KSB1 bacterium]NIU28561.1 CADD family putative folate metabolism protein [candidate division KSB1 bacterium]